MEPGTISAQFREETEGTKIDAEIDTRSRSGTDLGTGGTAGDKERQQKAGCDGDKGERKAWNASIHDGAPLDRDVGCGQTPYIRYFDVGEEIGITKDSPG
jgi:hypothetical protein